MRSQTTPPKTQRLIDFDLLARRVYREFTGNPQKALTMAQSGIALARRRADLYGEARMTLARAHSLRECGRLIDALKEYDRAALLFRRSRRTAEAWRTSIGKMDALDQMGRYSEALSLARRAFRYFQNAGLPLWAAKIEANTGNIYQHLDRYTHALKCYRRAYPILSQQQPGDGFILLFNQATTYLCSGQPQDAIDLLNSCRSFFDENGLSSFLARTHYNLAYGHYLLGKYQDALNHLEEARTRLVKLRDSSFLASCHLDESELYLRLNRIAEALRNAAKARRGFARLKMPYELAEARALQGIALLRNNRIGRAIPHLKEARAFFSREQNRIKSAELDSNLALAFVKRKQFASALHSLKSSHAIFRKYRIYTRMVSSLTYIAGIQRQMGRLNDAHATLKRAQPWLRRITLPWVLLPYYQLYGCVEADLNLPTAMKSLDKAVRLTESMRSEIPAEDLRISYSQDKLAAFHTLIQMGLRKRNAGGSESAFRYSERARSQVLLDLLDGSLRFEKAQAADSLMNGLSSLRSESWRRTIGATAASGMNARNIEAQVLQWMRKSQTAGLSEQRQAFSLSAFRKTLAPDQAVVSYYVIENSIHAFVLDANGLAAYPEIATLSRIAPRRQFLRFQLERARMDPRAEALSCDLHLEALGDALLAPMLSRLEKSRIWTMIPHGPLHSLPFHLLRDRNGFLLDRHIFTYSPSASIYQHCFRSSSTMQDVTLIGNSDERAPSIRKEISEIRSLFPHAQAFTEQSADSRNLRRAALSSRILHIASHGRFVSDQPFFSGLLLADGWFTLPQIYGMKLNADLVTLSGCETGESEVSSGDELLGLVRGFLYAGASSLLVSLWRVDDESTVCFMREFYRRLSEGSSRSDAWQAATLHTKEHWPHPYHWGPFLLVGKP